MPEMCGGGSWLTAALRGCPRLFGTLGPYFNKKAWLMLKKIICGWLLIVILTRGNAGDLSATASLRKRNNFPSASGIVASGAYHKLQPHVRVLATIPVVLATAPSWRNLVHPVLLVDEGIFESLPRVVASNEAGATLYAPGAILYVKDLTAAVGSRVALFSKFRQLRDPDSHENLGAEVRYDGSARVIQRGTISRLLLLSSERPVTSFDRVMAAAEIPLLVPHQAAVLIRGKIIAVDADLNATAATVVINRGSSAGVEVGQLYVAYGLRQILELSAHPQQLPPEIIGEILIYSVYAKVSFGIITTSARPLGLGTLVQSQRDAG